MKHPPNELLMIFTRYPVPGKTKTRLIPVLGARGAADLQREMTEHTLSQIKRFPPFSAFAVEVRYEGGDEGKVRDWLGPEFHYRPQGDGDIGIRMKRAFEDAFDSGSTAVVLIGTDIPEISCNIIQNAFEKLKRNQLVLGPAKDGGYYLIGLQRYERLGDVSCLFSGVTWGSDRVLSRTVENAENSGLRYTLLDVLGDIDRPEDLPQWERTKNRIGKNRKDPGISVILPTLNENHNISKTLKSIGSGDHIEVIVVDGGSDDQTVNIAKLHSVRVINGSPPRSRQMNRGAREAVGETLLFLHADTLLPERFDELILESLKQPGTVAGAFELRIDSNRQILRHVERLANWRSRHLKMPYGDQAIFLPAEIFKRIGGFPDIPIMEDFELIRRLKKQGEILILPSNVRTSPRRWENLGVVTTTLINQLVIVAHLSGVPPRIIEKWYRRRRGVRHR